MTATVHTKYARQITQKDHSIESQRTFCSLHLTGFWFQSALFRFFSRLNLNFMRLVLLFSKTFLTYSTTYVVHHESKMEGKMPIAIYLL